MKKQKVRNVVVVEFIAKRVSLERNSIITLRFIQILVAIMLVVMALALGAGII